MLNIFLIVAGIVFVIISFLISEKLDKNGQFSQEASKMDIWTDKDEQRIKERMEMILSEKTEEAMIKTDDQLGQISNEKIMALSEFSDQILEKIKQNHTEVVFLFDMLNEKDNEIKKLVQELTIMKTKTETSIKNVSEEITALEKLKVEDKVDKKPKMAIELLKESEKKQLEKEIEPPMPKVVNVPKKKEKPVMAAKPINDIGVNKNKQILTLFEEGNSIIEIAKLLGLGQGEVKLVIDLFRGTRG